MLKQDRHKNPMEKLKRSYGNINTMVEVQESNVMG
jgi:hypothetical protein